MTRLIIASRENGSDEEVIFTDELKDFAIDFVSPGLTIDIDTQIEDLPSGFPLNHVLKVDRS